MASSSAPIPISSASSSSSLASSASTSSPCAACKFLRRKCQPDCVFAPYFPPDQPQKFVHVHRVFGASNVTKLLNDLQPYQREDAVNSLAYEADMRLRDPVYGCVGVISILQHQLRQLQTDLTRAKYELSQYQSSGVGTHASVPAAISAATGFASGGIGCGGFGHNFININQPISMGGFAFGREQFYSGTGSVRDIQHSHLIGQRSYHDAELVAKLGANGAYDAGLMAAMNASAASNAQLGNEFVRSSPASGDERSSIGPS